MKKVIVLMLLLVSTVSFYSCSEDKEESNEILIPEVIIKENTNEVKLPKTGY